MITIHLSQLRFYAHHGIHEEERLLGGQYLLDAAVQFHEVNPIEGLQQTINYAEVFGIIRDRMEIPTPLLETVVMDIGRGIQQRFDFVRSIHLTLHKLDPPVSGLQGNVGVSWHKEF